MYRPQDHTSFDPSPEKEFDGKQQYLEILSEN